MRIGYSLWGIPKFFCEGEMKKAQETAITLAGMGMRAEKITEAVKVSLKLVQERILKETPCLSSPLHSAILDS